jgi:hypothetical protein
MTHRPRQPPPAGEQPPRGDDREIELPEPAWYLSSWELRSGLTVIEHDDLDTGPGGLGD